MNARLRMAAKESIRDAINREIHFVHGYLCQSHLLLRSTAEGVMRQYPEADDRDVVALTYLRHMHMEAHSIGRKRMADFDALDTPDET